jgi:dolichol-phosphate mannosyltransferase
MDAERGGAGALICVPTYEEVENLPLLLERIWSSAPLAHVLVADDASPDGTGELADRIARADARLHVLHRAGKQGLAKAYLAAFAWALERDYRVVVQMDADLSHDPSNLPAFFEALASRADVVVGSRRVRGGGIENWGPVRHFVSWGGSTYSRLLLGLQVRDLTGGFNGWRREVLESIGLAGIESTGYCFQIELKYRAVRRGFRVLELPIVFRNRERGTSKMDFAIFLEGLLNVWKLRGVDVAPAGAPRGIGARRP